MEANQINIAKQIITTSTAKQARPEVYPLSSANPALTVDNMPISVIKNMYGRYQAKVTIEGLSYPVDIKGILDTDNLPTTGKLVQLTCAVATPWEVNGRSGTIDAGTTKAYVVV